MKHELEILLVADVLADALVPAAVQVDDGRPPRQMLERERVRLQLDAVDDERQVADGVKERHRRPPPRPRGRRCPRSARGSRRACGRRSRGGGTRARTASRPGPMTPCAAASASARSISGSTSSRLSSAGRPSRSAAWRPSRQCARATRAASFGALDPGGDRRPAVRRVEERQVVGPVAEHRHAERLEQLGRRGHVQERLDARGDDQHLGPGELAEVGGHVGRSPASRGARRRARPCP